MASAVQFTHRGAPLELTEISTGWIFEDQTHVVFFGNAEFDESKSTVGNHVPVRRLKQVHSARIVESSEADSPQADGHFIKEPKFALAIRTADCIPVVIICEPYVMALHAGWRGVAHRIIPEGLQILARLNADLSLARIWLGPHIQQKSFVIREDALTLLEKSGNTAGCVTSIDGRTHFSLARLARAQLAEFNIIDAQVFISSVDTMTNQRMHSFRRDGPQAGRLGSYVYKK